MENGICETCKGPLCENCGGCKNCDTCTCSSADPGEGTPGE